jgi:hypothetical protein
MPLSSGLRAGSLFSYGDRDESPGKPSQPLSVVIFESARLYIVDAPLYATLDILAFGYG